MVVKDDGQLVGRSASGDGLSRSAKMELTILALDERLKAVKLLRTDTTLDLSQKAR